MPMGRCTAGIAVFALLISPVSLPAQNGAAKSARTITAVRASEKVILDGVLNDRVWEAALPATEFTQRDPDEGKPATERTELRVAYDDFNIYFGVRLFDTEPQKIVRQLSRRDNYADADTFTIQISPYHDRLTGAVFEVSAAGVQRDAIVSNDVFTDYSWEGVWESSVQVDELGWSLEIRVPFSQLRFPRAERQVWGINAARFIHRKNEPVWLQLVPKTENGLASRRDDLAGIDGIEPHKHLDLMPYVVGRDRKSTRLNSSHGYISYAVFCLKKKKKHSRDNRSPMNPSNICLYKPVIYTHKKKTQHRYKLHAYIHKH